MCQLGYPNQSVTKDDPCACNCCEFTSPCNQPPQNVYITIPR
jgi:hypothetical protein